MHNKEKPLWHRIKDVLLEIFIIVFAVSISIWFHNLNEDKKHEHLEVEFLEGISRDLEKDVAEMMKAQAYYKKMAEYNNTLSHLKSFSLHNTRFEALKFSNRLGVINNKELLLDIMDFYQEALPFINSQREVFNEENEIMKEVMRKNAVFDGSGRFDFEAVLKKPEVCLQANLLRNSIVILKDYPNMITRNGRLIEEINEEIESLK